MLDVLQVILKVKICVKKLHLCAIALVLPMDSAWIVSQATKILEEIVSIGIVNKEKVIFANNA